MTTPDRRCGTCRYRPKPSASFVACGWASDPDTKLPVGVLWDAVPMLPNEGTDCPTWEAKPDA